MQVHWHEGLFLLPHHLQRIQRRLNESASAERRLNWAYPYGVIDARLSNDDLENLRLRFDRLTLLCRADKKYFSPRMQNCPRWILSRHLNRAAGSSFISVYRSGSLRAPTA